MKRNPGLAMDDGHFEEDKTERINSVYFWKDLRAVEDESRPGYGEMPSMREVWYRNSERGLFDTVELRLWKAELAWTDRVWLLSMMGFVIIKNRRWQIPAKKTKGGKWTKARWAFKQVYFHEETGTTVTVSGKGVKVSFNVPRLCCGRNDRQADVSEHLLYLVFRRMTVDLLPATTERARRGDGIKEWYLARLDAALHAKFKPSRIIDAMRLMRTDRFRGVASDPHGHGGFCFANAEKQYKNVDGKRIRDYGSPNLAPSGYDKGHEERKNKRYHGKLECLPEGAVTRLEWHFRSPGHFRELADYLEDGDGEHGVYLRVGKNGKLVYKRLSYGSVHRFLAAELASMVGKAKEMPTAKDAEGRRILRRVNRLVNGDVGIDDIVPGKKSKMRKLLLDYASYRKLTLGFEDGYLHRPFWPAYLPINSNLTDPGVFRRGRRKRTVCIQ